MAILPPESDARNRARAIARYDVLGRSDNPELQAIVELTAQVCRTPMATINLITEVEQIHVAAFGIDPMVCAVEDAMCAAVLHDATPVVIADCLTDPRFSGHPFVNGEEARVRFYASHQLRTHQGVVIGTLCVYDWEPRELDQEQVEGLATLAGRVVDVLELSLRNRQLAASNDRLTVFAGRVSHDLKSPLASLTMSLGLLREQLEPTGEPVDPSEARWLLERAVRGAGRMTAMIDQILEHTHTGGLELGRVDLDRVLTTVLDDIPAVPGDVVLARMPLPTVRADETLIRSVLQNVVDNAVKYRHPARPLRIEVGAVEQQGVWRIRISDNGVGIPEDQRERVFEPRVRLDSATGAAVPGSGIGLDTSRRVIREHGGRIGVEDGIDGGTTVWFELAA